MSDDVAIVGIGMHPFGRHEGVTGMEQGAVAIQLVRMQESNGVIFSLLLWQHCSWCCGHNCFTDGADWTTVHQRSQRMCYWWICSDLGL